MWRFVQHDVDFLRVFGHLGFFNFKLEDTEVPIFIEFDRSFSVVKLDSRFANIFFD